jgi:hypothetical protein
MKTLFVLIFVFLSLAFATNAQHTLCIAPGNTPGSIDFKANELDSFLHPERYKVILLGEMHNGSFNPEFQFHFITQLNRTCGIRHVFMEMGPSCAWRFNQFLVTGDSSFLNRKSLVAYYGKWPEFWKRLYAYNRALPDAQKVVFHGLDFERTEVFEAILMMAPSGRAVPPSLKLVMDTVRAHVLDSPFWTRSIVNGKLTDIDNSSGFMRTLDFIRAQFKANQQATEDYFGANYSVINEIVENDGRVTVSPKPRNKTMFQNMQRITGEQEIEKFIGIFGAQHSTYTVNNSIANSVSSLKNISEKDVLNIAEIVYNLRRQSDSSLVSMKNLDAIIPLNGNCKATIVPAKSVPGYRWRVDYVVIADAMK